MDQEWLFYKLMDDFLEKNVVGLLKNKRIVAVEIPKNNEMYYVAIESYWLDHIGISLFKGPKGLRNIMMSIDKNARTVDLNQRSNYIGVTFNQTLDQAPENFLDYRKNNSSSALRDRGFPVVFLKKKAYKPVPISMDLSKDIVEVFTALTSVSLKNLKKVHSIHQNTVLDTLFKKDGIWQREKRKVKLIYPKIKYSLLESYPLLKSTKQVSDTWHITSIYHMGTDDSDEVVAKFGVPCHPGSISVSSGPKEIIYFEYFVGPGGELPTLKNSILECFKRYEIRPERIVTDLRMIYHALEDFAKSLNIQLIYNPKDKILVDLVNDYVSRQMRDPSNFDSEDEALLSYFLELKGVSRTDFNNLSEEASDILLEEFDSAMSSVEEKFDDLFDNNVTASFMSSLSEEGIKRYMLDLIKTHFRNLNKG